MTTETNNTLTGETNGGIEFTRDTDKEGSEFGAGPVYGCPECFVMVWLGPPAEDEECPACGFPGEFDTLHLIPARQTRGSEVDQ